MEKCDLGLIGLAVMGQNLALNIAGRGFPLAVFNRTVETGRKFVAERGQGLPVHMAGTLKDFAGLLKKPRSMLLMVKAGKPVDETLSRLFPLLEPNDLVADCGNSFFKDTERRAKLAAELKIIYLGIGVSGGEEGALKGPSLMPGGPVSGWNRLKPMLEAIAAREKTGPCVAYIGPAGAGHFVKMVHNGIEYGDMQLVAEAYDLLHRLGGFKNDRLAQTFAKYNHGRLASYLIEITAEIFAAKDPETGKDMVDLILDQAGQKGTGMWTSNIALELSEPIPTITAAVEARNLSTKKAERLHAEKILPAPKGPPAPPGLARAVEDALYCSKLSLYSQGMSLLAAGSREYDYRLNRSELARIWKGGCIIRGALLEVIQRAFAQNPQLPNLLLAPESVKAVKAGEKNWRKVIALAIAAGIPVPAMSSALYYFDSLRAGRLPANLIQAQRDFFGAHTFERMDRPGIFHHDWKK